MPRNAWQRLVEKLLPWYDPRMEDLREVRSKRIHREAIDARISAERTVARVEAGGLRGDYSRMDQRLKGR